MRRRRGVIAAWQQWSATPWGRALSSQSAQAAMTPRAERVIDLLGLSFGKTYVDFGCGTAPYAHLLADRAGLDIAPYALDIAAGPLVDAVAWPEKLPLADDSVDCFTSFYFMRRFDDDVVHEFGEELRRVLAPGGSALILEVAPVKSDRLEKLHERLLSGGCAQVDLRGWGRLAALFTECGFDGIDLVNAGPYILPPIPRVGVLLRRA